MSPLLIRSLCRIIQVTSEGGVHAFPGIGAYHASKWVLEGLPRSLSLDWVCNQA